MHHRKALARVISLRRCLLSLRDLVLRMQNYHVVQVPIFPLDSSSDQSTYNEYFSQLVSASLKKERVLLTNFRRVSNGCILINYGEPLIKHISKLKYFPSPSRNKNDFLLHAVCYEERACQLLKFSMSQGVKTGPFETLIIESFQKIIYFNVFPKINVVLFIYYQR